jgi:hypothetical protein
MSERLDCPRYTTLDWVVVVTVPSTSILQVSCRDAFKGGYIVLLHQRAECAPRSFNLLYTFTLWLPYVRPMNGPTR